MFPTITLFTTTAEHLAGFVETKTALKGEWIFDFRCSEANLQINYQ